MNDEIKEILENIKCPQLGYDEYGKWGALPLKVRITLKRLCDYVVSCDDYITNLQQENEILKRNDKNTYETSQEMLAELQQAKDKLQKDYQEAVDKIEELKEELEEEKRIEEADLKTIQRLEEENERLKQVMLIKQYHSETLPEGTEFVVLTKENYDRQQKDIQLELIDYKSRCEKASDKLSFIDEALESDILNIPLCIVKINSALNILQNGSDDNGNN